MSSEFFIEELESRRLLSYGLPLEVHGDADSAIHADHFQARMSAAENQLSAEPAWNGGFSLGGLGNLHEKSGFAGFDDEIDDGDAGWSVGNRAASTSPTLAADETTMQTALALTMAQIQTHLAKERVAFAQEDSAHNALLIAGAVCTVALSALTRDPSEERTKAHSDPANLGLFFG